MYWREHRRQLSFEDFFLPFGGKLMVTIAGSSWLSLFRGMSWRITTRLGFAKALAHQQNPFAWRWVH